MGMGMARVVRRAPPPKMLELVANPGYLHVRAAPGRFASAHSNRGVSVMGGDARASVRGHRPRCS